MFKNIDDIKQYINVSKYLDFKIVSPYIEVAVSERITPLIGSEVIQILTPALSEGEGDESTQKLKNIAHTLRRAVANYAVAYSIPFLKTHLSSTGANAFTDGKMERSPWWDIRDYGLSAIAIADRSLSEAILALLLSDLKDKLPIINHLQATVFASPTDFSKIYPIGNSYEVFLKFIPLMQNVWDLFLSEKFSSCLLEDIKKSEKALNLVRHIIAYHTLSEAVTLQYFTFTNTGIIIQWEQLPWQKSQLLSENQLQKLPEIFTKKANLYTDLLLEFLRKNPDDFPCFQDKESPKRKVITKKSGIYF